MNTRHKVVAVSQLWATIFATLFTAAIVGGVAYAWDDRAEKAEIRTKVEVIEKAHLPDRMTRIEAKLENTNSSINRVESQQAVINEKIDRIIERLGPR